MKRRILIALWTWWLALMLIMCLDLPKQVFAVALVAPLLWPIIMGLSRFAQEVLILIYGYGYGACWSVGIIGLVAMAAGYFDLTAIPIVILVGVATIVPPIIIRRLGKRFMIRAPLLGGGEVIVAIDKEDNVTAFGTNFWKEPGSSYARLPKYPGGQGEIIIERTKGRLKIEASVWMEIHTDKIKQDLQYYDSLYHNLPSEGFVRYFRDRIKEKLEATGDEMIPDILEPEEGTDARQNIVSRVNVANPFPDLVEVYITARRIEAFVTDPGKNATKKMIAEAT